MNVPEEPEPQSAPAPLKVEGLEIPLGDPEGPTDIEAQEGLVPPDLPEQTPPQLGEMLQTECAFLVFKTPEGIWAADSTAIGKPIAMGREATFHDMRHAAHDILHGITVQETAQTAVMMQQQVAQGMMEQAAKQRAAAEMAQRLGGLGGGVDLSDLGRK